MKRDTQYMKAERPAWATTTEPHSDHASRTTVFSREVGQVDLVHGGDHRLVVLVAAFGYDTPVQRARDVETTGTVTPAFVDVRRVVAGGGIAEDIGGMSADVAAYLADLLREAAVLAKRINAAQVIA